MTDNRAGVPAPSVMPIDRDKWAAQLNLSNFINTYYQYRDLCALGECKTVLIIGPGQGLDKLVLQWRGYEVTTLDIDATFKPDVIGSVHDLSIFHARQFDVIIASHVLEHLAEPYLDSALSEIARIGRFALIYLPVNGVFFQLRLRSNVRDFDKSVVLTLLNRLHKPDGMTPRYMDGQHFWEVGMRGFSASDLKKRMSKYFECISIYRNKDWLQSQNFILHSKYSKIERR